MLIPSRRLILGAGTALIATPALAQARWPVRPVPVSYTHLTLPTNREV